MMPSNMIQMAKTMGRDNVTAMGLQRKKIPMMIISRADSMRVPLFGRNFCVRSVNTKREIPETRVKHPRSTAMEKRVSGGYMKHNTPVTTSRIPVMTNQILVLFFIMFDF